MNDGPITPGVNCCSGTGPTPVKPYVRYFIRVENGHSTQHSLGYFTLEEAVKDSTTEPRQVTTGIHGPDGRVYECNGIERVRFDLMREGR